MNFVVPLRLLCLTVVTALLLSGCTDGADSGGESDLTLEQAKSNTQLLRNSALSRLPPEVVDAVVVSSDLSAGCESEASDPDGLIRAWHSGARVRLLADVDPDTVADDLAESFIEQGWVKDEASEGSVTILSKATILTDIEITTKQEDVDAGKPAEIAMALISPCVVTDGELSKEVTQLEAMAF